MSDAELAIKINAYLAAHPYATRTRIIRKCNVSIDRCLRLHEAGMITFPAALTPSQAATVGARRSPWRTDFKLPGTPVFNAPERVEE
jgi:hypothetical protein